MAELFQVKEENPFKIRAYERAARIVEPRGEV
jgi:DNA polymerase/3'-5' exonuclease PolX